MLDSLIWGCACLLLGLGLALLWLSDPLQRWRLRNIPGPPALPLVGSMPSMLRHTMPVFFQQCHRKYGPVFKVALGRKWVVVVADAELQRSAGMRLKTHALLDPEYLRGQYKEVIQHNLFRASGDVWRHVRAAWQPAFSSGALAGYLPLMVECAGKLAAKLERVATQEGSGRVDMWRELGGMTLQVVGSTAYGVDFGVMGSEGQQQEAGGGAAAEQPYSVYGKRLAGACADLFRYSSYAHGSRYLRASLLLPELHPLLVPLAYAAPDRAFRALLEARRVLLTASFELMRGWRGAHKGTSAGQEAAAGKQPSGGGGSGGAHVSVEGGSNGVSSPGREAAAALPPAGPPAAATTASPSSPGAAPADEKAVAADGGGAGAAASAVATPGGPPAVAPGSFLGLMLAARDRATGQGLTDAEVLGQAQLFILAGYETTANALAFAVACIAQHPEVEAKLVAEIHSVLGPDRAPTEADLPLLPYAEAVFNEAMRLFPPAPAMTRLVEREPLKLGGVAVPPGTTLFLAMYSAHRDPAIWPRVDEFIPERFLPSAPEHAAVAPRLATAHAPFGYGARMCIGWKFAVQEAKVALACLYQRLSFELEPGQVPLKAVVGLTMAPRGGVWVRPTLRSLPA